MRAERGLDPIALGARCPRRVLRELPCPGRLLTAPDPQHPGAASPRLRCNGRDAHVVEVIERHDIGARGARA